MRITPKTRNVAGLSLAAAVAGTFAVVPVQAQEPTPAPAPSQAPAPAVTTTSTSTDFGAIVRGLGSLQNSVEKVTDKSARPGSGTAHARYSTDGWTFTAAAYNSVNGRIYAVSTGEGDKPAGHLLRMFPKADKVADLGPLSLGSDFAIERLASAAFTSRGELVLFSGPKFRVLDLSKDKVDGEVENISAVRARSGELKLRDGIGDVGLPSAWASSAADGKAKQLFAVSRDPEGQPYLWTLALDTGRVEIAKLPVKDGLDLTEIGALNYAYTKASDKAADTLVFADDEARSIEVRDGQVVATYFEGEIVDNYREVAYLPKGAGYKPVTEFRKPVPAAAAPAAPVEPGTADFKVYETGAPSLPTIVDKPTEPTSAPQSTATAAAAAERDVLFTVVDAAGHSRAGVEIEIAGSAANARTDKNGQARLEVPGDDALAVIDGDPHLIAAGQTSYRATTLADGAGATTTTATVAAHTLLVQVVDRNGTAVADAEVTSPDSLPGVNVRTNASGLAQVEIPEAASDAAYSFKVTKDGATATFNATSADRSANVTIETTSSTSTSRTSTSRRAASTGARFYDSTVRVRVVTDGGDPVRDAQVYSVDGLDIQTRGVNYPSGLTNENGYVDVFIPGDTGNGQKVRLSIRTAPSGYRTVTQSVDRDDDGVTLTLPKGSTTTSTKSAPQEILDVIKEVEPMLVALGGSAALGAGLSGSRVSTTSTTSTTATATTVRGSNLADMSTGRTTSARETATRSRSASSDEGTRVTRTIVEGDDERDGELAETGTPMTTVITLGVLAMLIGGAYIAMGRRRTN